MLHQVVALKPLFPNTTFSSRRAALQTLAEAFPGVKPEPHTIFLELRFQGGITIDVSLYSKEGDHGLFEVVSPRGYEIVSAPGLWRTLNSILLELDNRQVRGQLEEETKEGRRRPTGKERRKIEVIEEAFLERLQRFDEAAERALSEL